MRTVPELDEDGVAFFEHYWQRVRGDRALPPVSAIDPQAFPRALKTIYLLEGTTVDTLSVRLAGTFYREVYGREVTGERLIDLVPVNNRPEIYRDYEACLQNGQLRYRSGTFDWRRPGAQFPYRRLLMPFGAGAQVERIMGFIEFQVPD